MNNTNTNTKNQEKKVNKDEGEKKDRTEDKRFTWLGKQFYNVWQKDIWISILIVSVLTPQITYFLTAAPSYLHKVRLVVSGILVFFFVAVYINENLFQAYIDFVYRKMGLNNEMGLAYLILIYIGDLVLSRSLISGYIHQVLTKTQINVLAFLAGTYTVFATSILALLFSGLIYAALRSRYENFDTREEMVNSVRKCGQVRRLGGIWLKAENYTLTKNDFDDDDVDIEEKIYNLINNNSNNSQNP